MTLKEWREEAGLSQRALARELGVDHKAVQKWEAGNAPALCHQADIAELSAGEVTQWDEDVAEDLSGELRWA